jgi:putative endonuclease
MFYVYILQSEKFGTYYIGVSSDIQNRLALHNRGRVRSTKSRKPWKLLCWKQFDTLSKAMKLEVELKSVKKRSILEEKIKHFQFV